MVRVASLAAFPRHLIGREFYAHVPPAYGDADRAERNRKRDRLRKRQRRRESREQQEGIPLEVSRNGGGV